MEMNQICVSFDVKGGKKDITDLMPSISLENDFIVQYFGIWKVIDIVIKDLEAKTVLEFGTREGYSTRLFNKYIPEGDIFTVDIDKPKTDLSEFKNIHCIQSDVMALEWSLPVDILYIDDWHNPWHLYSELDKFSKHARVVMIHDVCLEMGNPSSLLRAIEEWCVRNMVVWTIYPMNGCGLAVIEIEKSRGFYANTIDRGCGTPRDGASETPPDVQPEPPTV